MYLRSKLSLIAFTSVLSLGLAGCQDSASSSASATLDTDDQKASYAIGLDIGQSLVVAQNRLDVAALEAGLGDALAERDARISDEEIQRVMMAFNEAVQAEIQAQSDADAATNLEAGAAYQAENGARDGVTVLPSGLQYEVMREADGPLPGPQDRVIVNYRGSLIDGTEFDSSYSRGEPATFGLMQVIPGFSEGLQLMPVGSQYRFVIPPELAYGPTGSPPSIGPNATLVFEIELIEIEQPL